MAVLDKHKVSVIIKWLTRVVSLHLIAPGRPVMLPEVACFGPCVSEPSSGEDTWEKKHNKKSVIICTVTKAVDNNRLNSLHMPTFLHPTAVKGVNPTAMRSRLH